MRICVSVALVLLICGCGSSGTRSSAKARAGQQADDIAMPAAPPAKPGVVVYEYRDPALQRGPGPIDPMLENPPQQPSHPVGSMRREGMLEVLVTWSTASTTMARHDVIRRHGLVAADNRFGRMERYILASGDARRMYDRLVSEDAISAVEFRRPELVGK